MARELGPRGVHVAHVIIDGMVKTPAAAAGFAKDAPADTLIEPAAIADAYWALHHQPRSAWTFETELRPFAEKW